MMSLIWKGWLRGPAAAVALATLLGGWAAAAAAQEVGVLAAVNRDVFGLRPTESKPRSLLLKDRLILNERVTTTEVGGGQVMFLDQTTLTLTPNSDIILDKYLYDPNKRTGELTVSVLKGAMRLVGGRISKTGVATIRTPSATIGIRGGIGNVDVDDDGSTTYIHVAGISSTIEAGGRILTVTREGGTVRVAAPSGGDAGDAGASGGGGSTGDEGSSGDEGSTGEADAGGGEGGAEEGGGGGDEGGAPVYVGVADEETLDESFGASAGEGDGGVEGEISPETVGDGLETVEQEVSGSDETLAGGPISTLGEQETTDSDPSTGDSPTPDTGDDIADNNQAQAIEEELDQILDGVKFRGTWSALAGLSNGGFAQAQSGLTFQLDYSLTRQEGIVALELPDTGDLNGPNTTDLDGNPLEGDKFLVTGDDALNVDGSETTTTLLGGDPGDTSLLITQLDQIDRLNGSVTIDYTNSQLANTDFVDGDVTPVDGTRVVGQPIEDAVDQFQ